MIPGQTQSAIAWQASPIQRTRWAQTAASHCTRLAHAAASKPFAKVEPVRVKLASDTSQTEAAINAPKAPDHWFVKKNGRTLSDGAIRLLRLRDWYEMCLTDRRLDSEVMEAEWRLRAQAAFIIGWCA